MPAKAAAEICEEGHATGSPEVFSVQLRNVGSVRRRALFFEVGLPLYGVLGRFSKWMSHPEEKASGFSNKDLMPDV